MILETSVEGNRDAVYHNIEKIEIISDEYIRIYHNDGKRYVIKGKVKKIIA